MMPSLVGPLANPIAEPDTGYRQFWIDERAGKLWLKPPRLCSPLRNYHSCSKSAASSLFRTREDYMSIRYWLGAFTLASLSLAQAQTPYTVDAEKIAADNT